MWKKAFKKEKNIHVIYKYSSNDWIKQAKLFIHTNCTTGIEATFFKKPVIRFLPDTKHKEVFNTASYFWIELNEKELVERFNNIYEEQIIKDNQFGILSNYLANTYSADSAKNIINLITHEYEKIFDLNEKAYDFKVSNSMINLLYTIRYYLLQTRFLSRIMPGKIKRKIERGKKLGKITKKELAQTLQGFNEALNTQYKYKITKIAADTFLIKNNM